ncbi:MAG: hypothetical protein JXI33_00655 [Candidatus Aminicenantes bacterium]|nr:hypothetical protein [Candidatus Aminicenantes bacterium]
MTHRDNHSQTRRRWPLWPFFFFIVLVAVSLLLHVEKKQRRQEIRQTNDRFTAMVNARPLDQIKAQRARFYEIQFYLAYPSSISYATADLILRLHGIIRPLRLLELQVEPGLHDLKFELRVGVTAAAPEQARRQFAVFFEKLRNLSGVTQASFSVADRAGSGEDMHAFAIIGQVEWP